jgi:hypothetical protein
MLGILSKMSSLHCWVTERTNAAVKTVWAVWLCRGTGVLVGPLTRGCEVCPLELIP